MLHIFITSNIYCEYSHRDPGKEYSEPENRGIPNKNVTEAEIEKRRK